MSTKLILASGSPFRKQLLEQVGLNFEVVPAQVNERALEQQFTSDKMQLARHLAQAKALEVFNRQPESLIIGSDQVLLFENQCLAKPQSLEEAEQRLSLLSGKTHQLYTSYCLLDQSGEFTDTVVATLTMHSLSEQQIKDYVAQDQPKGCAGGYKIEKQGPILFSKIETSDFYSIIGLPLLSLCNQLRCRGILRP